MVSEVITRPIVSVYNFDTFLSYWRFDSIWFGTSVQWSGRSVFAVGSFT